MLTEFPTEILVQICADLPPSSLLALHESCRRFASLIPTSTKRLYSQSQPYNKEKPYSPEWLLYLAMLERDGRLHNNLVCRVCSETHDRTHFSSHEQQKSPLERMCLGFQEKMWVCPHRLWTRAELRLLHQGQQQLKMFHWGLWPVEEPCPCLKRGKFLHWLFLPVRTERPSSLVGANFRKMFGVSRPAATTHQHLRLRDPERRCFQHEECTNLGDEEIEFDCRMCIEDRTDSLNSRQRLVQPR